MAKELAAKDDHQYAIMKGSPDDVGEIISENLGEGEQMSVMDFTRVSVPAGGSTTWTIPDIDQPTGELEAKEINGIIIATKTTRQYWPDAFDGGGSPPQCASEDGVTGIGDPGGLCTDCPLNEFGSDPDGRKKACQEKRLIFIVRQDDFLPTVVVGPAGSLKNIRKYLVDLASKRKVVHSVYSSLSLEKDKNADGIAFSKIVLRKIGDVENPAASKAYTHAIKPYLVKVTREMAQEG